jgi:hypothetical protein
MDLIKKSGLLIAAFVFFNGPAMLAQDHNHDHDHSHHHHAHQDYEIGLGNYLSYLAGEKEFASPFIQSLAQGYCLKILKTRCQVCITYRCHI